MSNQVTPITSIVPFTPDMPIPAHLLTPSVLDAAMNTALFATQRPKISIKAGRFRLVEEGVEEVLNTFALEVVVVGLSTTLHKTWFSGPYVEGENTSPACASDDGIRPNAGVPEPQSDLCATCPQNAWGSAVVNGKDMKACSDRLSIAVVDSCDVGEGTMYEVDIPPGSLGNFKEYVKQLRQRKLGLEKVVTVMSFDANASAPKLQFGLGGFLSVEQLHGSTARALSQEAKETVRQADKPAALPTPVAQPALAAPKPVAPPRAASTMGMVPPMQINAPAPAPAPAPAAKGFGKKKAAATAPQAAPAPVVQQAAAPAIQGDALADLEKELAAFTGTDD